MSGLHRYLRRQIACGLVMLLATPCVEIVAASPGQMLGSSQQNVSPVQNLSKDSDSRAGNPGTDATRPAGVYPDSPEPKPAQSAGQSAQFGPSKSGSEPMQSSVPKPVGTAAAPSERTTGVAASRPAGAVIAPAKQRRARSILIRVGVIVGAAVAIGTVVALSEGSPSRSN